MLTINDVTCPFDTKPCQSKQNYFEELRMFAFGNPELVFPYTTNLFRGCPIKHDLERKEICERFRQHCINNSHEQR